MNPLNNNNSLPSELFTLHQHDAKKMTSFINTFTSNGKFIDTTITSPPYFDMKLYDDSQIGINKEYNGFLDELSQVYNSIYNLTNDTGSLWIIVDTFTRSKELITFPFDLISKLKSQKWILKDIFIWKKDRTLPYFKKGNLRNIKEYILYFVKSQNFQFYPDRIREFNPLNFKEWWVKYPERYNPKGTLPTNIWEFPIPTQGSWGTSKMRHFNPLPYKLIERIVKLSTNEGDVVLDPFAGVGTVLAVSNYMNRFSLGFEIKKEYIEMFKEIRIEEYYNDMNNNKEYVIEMDKIQKSLSNRLVKLRMIKYCKQLYNSINQNMDDIKINTIFIKVDFDVDSYYNGVKLNDAINADIILMLDKTSKKNQLINIRKLTKEKILSKFSISPKIKIYHRNNMKDIQQLFQKFNKVYLYKDGITYKYDTVWNKNKLIKNIDKIKTNKTSTVPAIISNLEVNEIINKTWTPRNKVLQEKMDNLKTI